MQRRNSYLVGKAFKSYIVASVLTVASTQVANIVDAAIVGNLIGPEALASVNLCKPVLQAFFSFSCLYVASATMMAGMAIGQGDKRKADKLFSFAVVTSLLLGIVLMVLGIAAFNPLSQLLCNSESLRQMTNDFLLVSILSAAPQLLMLALNQFLAVDGAPKLVTRNVFVGNVINILFDIVFIKVFGWGISGAAWATFVMYLVCIVMVIPHFRKKIRCTFADSSGATSTIGNCSRLVSPFSSVRCYCRFNWLAATMLLQPIWAKVALWPWLFVFNWCRFL